MNVFSRYRIAMLSFSQTPVVQIDRGPMRECEGVLCSGMSEGALSFSDMTGGGGAGSRRDMRFAITMSVNILSPTTISSSSLTGFGRDAK